MSANKEPWECYAREGLRGVRGRDEDHPAPLIQKTALQTWARLRGEKEGRTGQMVCCGTTFIAPFEVVSVQRVLYAPCPLQPELAYLNYGSYTRGARVN